MYWPEDSFFGSEVVVEKMFAQSMSLVNVFKTLHVLLFCLP
jgi:hypothetical protein